MLVALALGTTTLSCWFDSQGEEAAQQQAIATHDQARHDTSRDAAQVTTLVDASNDADLLARAQKAAVQGSKGQR